ncbi:MAG TPA: glycosyltransferase family 2 protein [Candidatus Woesebacteria bacterium]|nr:glycosyltransferase family 2 protein [Candidatus Woesebacteria bacterium]
MKEIDISIIVVGYKSEDTIVPFLDSIQKSRDGLNKEVIVVDNYPADRCVELARKHPLKPKVLVNTENVGLSKAVNWAIKESHGKYILQINPDTRIKGAALKLLFDFAEEHPVLGAVAPKLLYNDGKIQPSCYKFPTIGNALKYYFLGCKNCFNKYYPGNKTTKVDIAVMAAFLIPRTTINQVGGLDERFFLYYEDVEYCRRLHKYGLPVYYYPKAKVMHTHGASGSFSSHLSSPLAKSAKIYHGELGSTVLNTVLWAGQKWQKLLKLLHLRK